MTGVRKLTFAPFVAAACALWIASAALGSQGFTVIIGLLATISLVFARPDFYRRTYVLVAVAAIIWIALSTLWSPVSADWSSGSLTSNDFSIDIAAVRLIGVAIFSALAIGAALKIPDGAAQKSSTAVVIFIALMAVLIVGVYVFRDAVLELAYPGQPEQAQGSGMQNMQRAANSVAVMLPISLAVGWHRYPSPAARMLMALIAAACLLVFQLLGSQSAVMSFLLMFAGFCIAKFAANGGIKTLLRVISAYILLVPVLMLGATKLVGVSDLRLPESFQARIFAWQEIVARIFQRPLTGHGLEATGTWQDTYAGRPKQLDTLVSLAPPGQEDAMRQAWEHYPIVPGHPHNMALELWVETGLVGAVLVAAAFWLAAGRLSPQDAGDKSTTYATAGLIGASLPLFSFAYSAWNESFWAMLAIAICAIIVLAKREGA